jgi:hypothetical protein
LFAVEVSMLTASAGGTFLPEIRFACAVAVQDVSLSAFFIIQDKGDSNASTIWPLSVVACFSETFYGK